MKRVLSLVLVGGVAFSLGHFLRAPIPHAGAAGGGPMPVSGDANGDGIVDIADAVYIINFQFYGGPAPGPVECPPTALPATGQTKCYDNEGNEIACDSADFPGQDGFYQSGCPSERRFVDNGDGTVTDNCTGLMWQGGTADTNGNGSFDNDTRWPTDRATWQEALSYCDNLSFAGHDDWRLPNVQELGSLLDYARWEPAMDLVFQAELAEYWSSSSWILSPEYSWVTILHGGGLMGRSVGQKIHYCYVRAVRNAP